jgi:hypothetical protein
MKIPYEEGGARRKFQYEYAPEGGKQRIYDVIMPSE